MTAVETKYHEIVRSLADQGLALAKAKGWKPKAGASEHEQAIDLVKAAVPLLIEELRSDGLIP